MGVKGLTSYVRSEARSISDQVTLAVPDTSGEAHGPLVIDGWAWIYTIYLSHFPDGVRGGDYVGFSECLSSTLAALRAADLDPIFVFDGPYLPLKLPTVLERGNSTASLNSAFMRSFSRTNARFQTQMSVVPPLLYDCTIETLRKEGVETVIAESEADSAVAETAERMQGWAVSNDSDFFILCSRGIGCKGYVPIDTLEYLVKLPQEEAPAEAAVPKQAAAPEEDDGFAQVGKKVKKGKAGRGATPIAAAAAAQETVAIRLPQSEAEGQLVAVRFTAYSSIKLAARLEIAPGMLPLFAAIVGNDYSSSVQTKILGQALPNGADRIARVAAVLKEERQRVASGRSTPATSGARSGTSTPLPRGSGAGGKGLLSLSSRPGGMTSSFSSAASDVATPTRGGPHPPPALASPPDPVRDMVQGVVERILSRPENTALARYVSNGEKAEVVDGIIESVCTYSLLTLSTVPHLSSPSAKFFNFSDRSSSSSSSSSVSAERASLIREYQRLYAAGRFDKTLVETLTQRLYFCKFFCEDPDVRSVQVTHARALRRWLWTVLFEVWGMDWARQTMAEPEPEDDSEDGHAREGEAQPIKLYGKGKSWVDEGGDDDELVEVNTPPSSAYESSIAESESSDASEEEASEKEAPEKEEDDASVDLDDLPSRPGSANDDDEEDEQRGPKPPPAVVEHARKGDRLVGDLREILPLKTLLSESKQPLPSELVELLSDDDTGPVAGKSETTRLALYHHAHSAPLPSTPSGTPSWDRYYTPLLVTLRYLIISERERLGESYPRSNWTKLEVIAVILSATRPSFVLSCESTTPASPPTTRSIHLHTSLQLTLLSSWQLAQSLRLVPAPLSHSPSQLVNGDAFHRVVLSIPQLSAQERYEATLSKVERQMVDYVLQDGVERMLSINVEAIRREKREAKRKEKRQDRVKREQGWRSQKDKVEQTKKTNAFAFLGGDEEKEDGSEEEAE